MDGFQCRHHAPAPYSDDSDAVALRVALSDVDGWKPLTLTSDYHLRSGEPNRPVRVYADGVYDLFHNGHAEQLRQAKTTFPNSYLIVGVSSDADVLLYKGTRPVMTEQERCEIVSHCRYADEVYRGPPFYPTITFVDSIKADLVAHDSAPYSCPQSDDCYASFKSAQRFLPTRRMPYVSTTELLLRIVSNLDMFKHKALCCKRV